VAGLDPSLAYKTGDPNIEAVGDERLINIKGSWCFEKLYSAALDNAAGYDGVTTSGLRATPVGRFGQGHWYLHRHDGPAMIRADGTQEWILHSCHHREDGPAVEGPRGRLWYYNGRLHREDGPAREGVDRRSWYYEGRLHREDGPAIEWIGSSAVEYYHHGQRL